MTEYKPKDVTMACWCCDEPVEGERYDGELRRCQGCGEDGMCWADRDGAWSFIRSDAAEKELSQ